MLLRCLSNYHIYYFWNLYWTTYSSTVHNTYLIDGISINTRYAAG